MYNPVSKVIVITNDGTKYDVSQAVTELNRKENDKEIAQCATIKLVNVEVDGKHLSSLFTVPNRVFIHSDDGEIDDEVFRGFIWTRPYKSKKEKELTLTCYDNSIYLQESEEYQFFTSGHSTESIFKTICQEWGINLHYNHESITHPKLPLRGKLADIFTNDLLEEVRKKTGKKAAMKYIKDELHVDTFGSNEVVYKLYRAKDGNVIETESEITMEGMITKVIILGKEDEDNRASVSATVLGNTDTYGTLQKILNESSGTELSEVKEEANQIIKDKGKPFESFSIEAIDIPWIRKGDKVEVVAGDMNGYFIVRSIHHDAFNKKMSLEVERA